MDSLLAAQVWVPHKERRDGTVVGGPLLREPRPCTPLTPTVGKGRSPQAQGRQRPGLQAPARWLQPSLLPAAPEEPPLLPGEALLPNPGLTIVRFHIEAEPQVLVPAQQPAVTGCCHVQHQPALVPSSERLKIQKE